MGNTSIRFCAFLQEARVKKLLALTLVLGTVTTSVAQVTLEVYEADGETPFDCNDDVMVGTKLALVVSSDSNDYWSGGLFIAGQDRLLGTLAGRGLDPNDPNARDHSDSHYEDAGDFAIVTGWNDSSIWGFDLYTFYPVDGNSVDHNTVVGDWFVIDYQADEVGDCDVGFYDYNISWDEPNYSLTFSHSPTRDLNFDEKVNFIDFATFASKWNATDCNDPNWYDGADLDRDGDVDHDDLRFFDEYWLWGASDVEAGGYPNSQQTMGAGVSETLHMQEEQQTQLVEVIDVNEMVNWLEELRLQEKLLRETYTEAEWQEFIDSVKNSYQ
jgi:hypothetical protein